MIARRLARKGLREQNKEKKKNTMAGIGRLRGAESVCAKLALPQEHPQMMQPVETIPKRWPVITRGKVHCLRTDFQGRLGAGRRAEGKKRKFPRLPRLPTEKSSQKRLSVRSCSALPPTGIVASRDGRGADMGQRCSRKEMDGCGDGARVHSQHARW